MKPRERVLTALGHDEPDRVPLDLGGSISSIHVSAYERLVAALGLRLEGHVFHRMQQIVWPDEPVLERFGVDFRRVRLRDPRNWVDKEFVDASGRACYVDEWGITWGRAPYYYDMLGHPLSSASLGDLERYRWPDPYDPGRVEGLREEAKRLCDEAEYALVANTPGCGVFERSWWLRGFQEFILDMYARPEFADRLLDGVAETLTGFYDAFLREVGDYVDIVMVSDDLGTQTCPITDLGLYRRFIKPRQRSLFQSIRSRTDAKILLHSCGSIFPLIEDLVEAGVDILNPIQPRAVGMESRRLKERFGDRLCFHGGVDMQRVLPFGSPEDVAAEVRRVLDAMAPRGGYILAAAHNIQADTPPQNIIAMFEAASEYGRYPLRSSE